LEWDEGAPLIADISTGTYNYFNPQRCAAVSIARSPVCFYN